MPSWSSPTVFWGITIGNNFEMTPRAQLVLVAYAYRVGTVDGATGRTISGKLDVGSGNTNAGTFANVFGENNTASGQDAVISGGSGTVPPIFERPWAEVRGIKPPVRARP